MHLTDTRYIKIDGTAVTAEVNTAAEAKLAVKELRHKKKEYTHLKRTLLKAKKQVEAKAGRAKRRPVAKPGALDQMKGFFQQFSRVTGALKRVNAEQDLHLIEREIKKADDILHNIDTVLLQIQGKLIHHS